jgi:hypothetical protein
MRVHAIIPHSTSNFIEQPVNTAGANYALQIARSIAQTNAKSFGYTVAADAEPVEIVFDGNLGAIQFAFEATKG